MLNSLAARIFAIFWFTFSLILFFVLLVPKLDTRKISELSKSEQEHAKSTVDNLEKKLIEDQINDNKTRNQLIETKLAKISTDEWRIIAVEDDGTIWGLDKNKNPFLWRTIHHFIGLWDETIGSGKLTYLAHQIFGPFYITDINGRLRIYFIRRISSKESGILDLIFDKPLLLLIVTMLISTPFLLWLSWSLAKPARRLKVAADEVARGNLRQHSELESGSQEFLAAGKSFNHMVRALEEMVETQQRLISDISHELRTPLTRLQLASALMRRRSGNNKELERIEKETQQLDTMIGELLTLSRMQNKHAVLYKILYANELWSEVLNNAAFEADSINKKLIINNLPGDWPIYGNQKALQSALENIIRNALRYANGEILIDFIQKDNQVYINVDDDGSGVNTEELEKIFFPFYRTDAARNRAFGGTGLGLSIVKAAIVQHNGCVKADHSSQLGGLQVTICLPCA